MNELTCREKAILTYRILQKRKVKKARYKELMVDDAVINCVARCKKRNHKRRR